MQVLPNDSQHTIIDIFLKVYNIVVLFFNNEMFATISKHKKKNCRLHIINSGFF